MFEPNQPLGVIWDDDSMSYWCIGFYINVLKEEEQIRVDHLTQRRKGLNDQWGVRPNVDDIQSVQKNSNSVCETARTLGLQLSLTSTFHS